MKKIIAALLLLSSFPVYGQKKDPQNIPVIIIMADQLRYDAVGQFTPHINALKKNGVVFNRAYCASPLCAPSRAAFFTGRYPNTNGCLINGWYDKDARYRYVKSGMPDLYKILSKHRNAWHIGKQHFFTRDNIDDDPKVKVNWITKKDYERWVKSKGYNRPGGPGFSARCPALVSGKYTIVKRYTIPEYETYQPGLSYFTDDYFATRCVRTIENSGGGNPLLLIATFMSPHPPFDIPEPYFSKISQTDLSIPDNVGQWYQGQSPLLLYSLNGFIGTRYSRQQWEKIWPKYFGLVSLLDDEVGRIIAALKQKGLYDKALIIFTSDHGEMLGSHSLWQKMCMYEESVRVPLIIKFPSDFHPAVRQSNQLVSLIDVWPTLMDYLHIPQEAPLDGLSLLPIINGEKIKRNRIFIQYDGNAGYGGNQRCVINGRYKLIISTFKEEVFLELYDEKQDPGEEHNLASDPRYKTKTLELIGEVSGYMKKTNDLLSLPQGMYANFLTRYTK